MSNLHVLIRHTNERGFYACNNGWDWAVVYAANPTNWINAFPTREAAIAYCEKQGYEIGEDDR